MSDLKVGDRVKVFDFEPANNPKTGTLVEIKDYSMFPYVIVDASGHKTSWMTAERFELSLENAEVGDLIQNIHDRVRRILAVLHRDAEKTVYILSQTFEIENLDGCDASKCTDLLATAYELSELHYKPYEATKEPEIVEKTVEQLEQELGVEAGALRIKGMKKE